MTKALRIHLTRPDTIAKRCTVLVAQRDLYKNEGDGFSHLLHILGSIFPRLDIVAEISSIKEAKTETFTSLLQKFTSLERKLSLSLVIISHLQLCFRDTLTSSSPTTRCSPLIRLFTEVSLKISPHMVRMWSFLINLCRRWINSSAHQA